MIRSQRATCYSPWTIWSLRPSWTGGSSSDGLPPAPGRCPCSSRTAEGAHCTERFTTFSNLTLSCVSFADGLGGVCSGRLLPLPAVPEINIPGPGAAGSNIPGPVPALFPQLAVCSQDRAREYLSSQLLPPHRGKKKQCLEFQTKKMFYTIRTCPELACEWEPMLWLLSSLLTLSRVGMLPLLLMLLMVPMVPRLCSFSRLPSPSVSRCSVDEPTTRPLGELSLELP